MKGVGHEEWRKRCRARGGFGIFKAAQACIHPLERVHNKCCQNKVVVEVVGTMAQWWWEQWRGAVIHHPAAVLTYRRAAEEAGQGCAIFVSPDSVARAPVEVMMVPASCFRAWRGGGQGMEARGGVS